MRDLSCERSLTVPVSEGSGGYLGWPKVQSGREVTGTFEMPLSNPEGITEAMSLALGGIV
jgi:hypothetical protein